MSEQDWLAERRLYLGGSDISALMGLDTYRAPIDVFLEKTGDPQGEKEKTWRMMRGTFLEDGLIRAYCKITGSYLAMTASRVRHPQYEFIGGNPDRLQLDKKGGEPVAVIEVKTVGIRQAYKWGQPGDGKIPMSYFVQANHYAGLLGMKEFVVVADIEGRDDLYYDHFAFDQDIYEAGVEAGVKFWNDHVVPRIAPPPDGSPSYAKHLEAKFPKDNGTEILADVEAEAAAERYLRIRAEIKELEEVKAQAEAQLKSALGENSVLVTTLGAFTWREQGGKVSWKDAAADLWHQLKGEPFDAKALADFSKAHVGKPFRAFRSPIDK